MITFQLIYLDHAYLMQITMRANLSNANLLIAEKYAIDF